MIGWIYCSQDFQTLEHIVYVLGYVSYASHFIVCFCVSYKPTDFNARW